MLGIGWRKYPEKPRQERGRRPRLRNLEAAAQQVDEELSCSIKQISKIGASSYHRNGSRE